jgi:hypothetical protein
LLLVNGVAGPIQRSPLPGAGNPYDDFVSKTSTTVVKSEANLFVTKDANYRRDPQKANIPLKVYVRFFLENLALKEFSSPRGSVLLVVGGAVYRILWRRAPPAAPVRCVPAVDDCHVLFDRVLAGLARMPLGVAVVEDANADHIATGRPIETVCVAGA